MQKDSNSQTLVDNALVEQEFLALIPGLLQSIINADQGLGSENSLNTCDSVFLVSGDTTDFDPNPIYKITFNGNYCSTFMPDQKMRQGSIYFKMTGKLTSIGTRMHMYQMNYISNNLKYSCDSVEVLIKESYLDQLVVDVRTVNGYCSSDTYSINYQSNTKMIIKWQDSPVNKLNHSFVYGTSSGVNRFGVIYTTTSDSSEPLNMKNTCAFFLKGIQKIKNAGTDVYTVNYGDGACDDIASYNIFENTVEFKLK